MSKLIPDDGVVPGDVVLNFCDPGFLHDPDEQRTQTAKDHLVRLLAYALYANRIFVPGRYLLAPGPFYDAVSWAPELLEQGILVPDIRTGVTTFRDLVEIRRLDAEAAVRAEFLDGHSKLISVFDDQGQSTRFHTRLLEDLEPTGALRQLIPAEHQPKLALIAGRFRDQPGSREIFTNLAAEVLPDSRGLFERWAAIRYYTTPMEFDAVRVRDIPHTAARLLAQAHALTLLHFEDPDVGRDLPDPMSEAAQRMALAVPKFYNDRDARLLVQAVLATREEVPEARQKLAKIIESAQAEKLADALNQVLLDSLRRERIFADLSPRMKDQLKRGAKESALSTLVGIVLGALMGPFAAAVDFVRGALGPMREARTRKATAPWKMSYEHLASHLARGERDSN